MSSYIYIAGWESHKDRGEQKEDGVILAWGLGLGSLDLGATGKQHGELPEGDWLKDESVEY